MASILSITSLTTIFTSTNRTKDKPLIEMSRTSMRAWRRPLQHRHRKLWNQQLPSQKLTRLTNKFHRFLTKQENRLTSKNKVQVLIKANVYQKFKIRALIWKFQSTLILKLWNRSLKVSSTQRYQSLPAINSTPPVSKRSPRGLCYDPPAPLLLLGEAFLWPLFLTVSINFAASLVMWPSNKLMKWGSLTHARFKTFTHNALTLTTNRPTTLPQACTVATGTAMVDNLRILKLHSTLTTSSSTVECPIIILWISLEQPPSSIHFTKITTTNCNSNPSTGASIMRSTLVAKTHRRNCPSPLTLPMTKKTSLTSFLTAKTSSRRKWCRRLFWLKTLKMAVINTTFPTTSINLLKGAPTKKIRKTVVSR